MCGTDSVRACQYRKYADSSCAWLHRLAGNFNAAPTWSAVCTSVQHNITRGCTARHSRTTMSAHVGPAASGGCLRDDQRKKGLSNPACATCAHPNLLFCVEVCCQLPACSSWLPKQEVKAAATCGVLVPAEVFAGVHTPCVCCLRSPVPRSQHQEAGDAPHAG